MKFPKFNPVIIFIIFFAVIISTFFYRPIFTKEVLIPATLLKTCYPWRTEKEIQNNDWENVDALFITYPYRQYNSHSIKEKAVPMWAPYIFCGTPFLANPGTAFFTPFNVLDFFIISPAYSYTVKLILTVFLSCLFMAILVFRLTKNHIASLLSGLIYGFNGFYIVNLPSPIFLDFMLWLPCLFLILILDAEHHSYLYGIIGGLVISVQILSGAGVGNLLFYTIVSILAFGLYFSRLRTALFSIALGIFLSAVQVLPTIEFAKYCQRTDLSFSRAPIYNLPFTLIASLFPNFFGDITKNSWWGYYLFRYLFNTTPDPTYTIVYAGVLPVFLALLVIGRKTDNRHYIFFGWLMVISFFFSHLYPLFTPILHFAPVLNKLRSHERALWLYIFSLSVLAGLGLSSLLQRDISFKRLRRIEKTAAVILIIVIILAGIVNIVIKAKGEELLAIGKDYVKKYYGSDRLSKHYNYSLAYYYRLVEDIILAKVKDSFSFKSFPYWRSIICLLAALFIIYSVRKRRVNAGWGWLCVAALLFDLFSYGLNKITCVKPETVYPATGAIELLQKKSREDYGRIIGLWQQELLMKDYEFDRKVFASDILPSESSLIFKLYDARGYSSLFPKDYLDFYRAFYPSGTDSGYNIGILFPDFNQRLFDLLSVRYVLTAPGYDMYRNNLNLIYDAEIRIYENKNALPRVFLPPEIKNVENREETFRILQSPDFDPHRLALVMGYGGCPIFDSQSIVDGASRIIDFQANKVAIEAHMKANGPLVLTDTYFPGWKAFIDRNETKIYRANYIHRMVVVPQGKHLVEFIYDPLSFKIGAIISAVTFTGCSIFVILFLISFLYRRR